MHYVVRTGAEGGTGPEMSDMDAVLTLENSLLTTREICNELSKTVSTRK